MRRHTTMIGWPRRDPRHYRFAVPNTIWGYKLKPVEFVIFSCLCYHSSASKPTLEDIAAGVHMTAGTVKKYLDSLVAKELVNEDGTPTLEYSDEKFFTMPNEVFLMRLPPSEFVVYSYLLLIEDRWTHTCHPSYNTIATATGLSKNTVMKSVRALLEMGLITVEPSSYFDKRGMTWKGNNLYTILPVRSAVDAFHQQQLCQLDLEAKRSRVRKRQVEYNRCHPRAALCAPASAQAEQDPPQLCGPLCAHVQGNEGEQDKSVASFAAPLATSARSAGSLRGTGVGSQAERKAQIEVAHRPDPVAARD